ncbi:MAG: uracil-DNA glycosylase [Gammaproteobacteria bacterium]
MFPPASFDPDCQRCPRLAGFLQQVRHDYPAYHAKPVASFGDADCQLLIVGLAPGLHGANASGRPFTGDHAGILLYQTLYDFGFSSGPVSRSKEDGLRLRNCRISNAVKCVPPRNKPDITEIRNCNGYLQAELNNLPSGAVILALGTIAHNAVLRAMHRKLSQYRFGHGAVFTLERERRLVDSYHCSRYNTQTRRLTPAMFHQVFQQVVELLAHDAPVSTTI